MARGSDALDEVDAAFEAMARADVDGVIVQGTLSAKAVADLAVKYRLPTSAVPLSYAEVGGLLSYGASFSTSFRQSAVFVHKILQGTKPAEIPIEQPTKFELIINLKTAKALGITISDSFLNRADRLIE
jgi:putative ABC transport system substrate-binding protein